MKIYNARNLVTFRNIVVQVLLQVRIIIISVENCKSFTYKFDMNRLIIALNEIRQEKFKIKTPLNFALIQGQLSVLREISKQDKQIYLILGQKEITVPMVMVR